MLVQERSSIILKRDYSVDSLVFVQHNFISVFVEQFNKKKENLWENQNSYYDFFVIQLIMFYS